MKAYDDPHAILRSTRLVDRFLEYVAIDTQSDAKSDQRPTTPGQLILLEKLKGELEGVGLDGVTLDENGYLTATLPGNCDTKPMGLMAHVDTAPAFSGKDIGVRMHEGYAGGAIELEGGVTITPEDNPELERCKGDTIITSDGTTLLGADDKAGIAVIMTMIEQLVGSPELPRPPLRIAFTPDEEIGRGTDWFPLEQFGADVAFTLDGGFPGEVNVETFSADSAHITIHGVSTHPGTAKGKLVNAIRYMARFLDRLPELDRPEYTEGREGFIHIDEIEGNAAKVKVHIILRDFEDDLLAARGALIRKLASELEQEEPRLKVEVKIIKSYRNMRIMQDMRPSLLGTLMKAVRMAGVEPEKVPVRGGTDGSRLTEKGLPTPNLFAGGVNFHGPTEWISTRAMGQSVCAVLNLVQVWAEGE